MVIVSEEIASELPEYCGLLSDITTKVTDVVGHIKSVRDYVQKKEFSTVKGISLLELKCHLMLHYLTNIVQLMLLKIKGTSIAGSPTIERLVELRVVLEKMRPLEMKLRYQIDKLVKVASTGLNVSVNDPLHYRPNPGNLVPKINTMGSHEKGQQAKYVPPKLRAMPFEDESEKERKDEDKRKKKALRSSLVSELREELSEGPQEIKDETRAGRQRKREREEEKERERYEENYFVRMSGKKKQRVEGMTEAIDDLLDFGNLTNITGEKRKNGGGRLKKKLGGAKKKIFKGKKKITKGKRRK